MIDPSEIRSFVTVAEEKSFSAAALKLGITQSAVSQKVRRLEDQLALHLLDRTSRSVQISLQGEDFMPHAYSLLAEHEKTRIAANEIRSRHHSTLLLGGDNFLVEERLRLVEHFLGLNPAAQVDVYHADRAELFQRLALGNLDAVIALALPGQVNTAFDYIHVERRGCHIAFPPKHPLAERDNISFEDLRGLPMVISPGRQYATILSVIHDHLTQCGILLVPAPEADRRVIEQFAHVRELPYMRWYPEPRMQHTLGGFTVLPVTDSVLFTDLFVYFRKCNLRTSAERFRAATHAFDAHLKAPFKYFSSQ